MIPRGIPVSHIPAVWLVHIFYALLRKFLIPQFKDDGFYARNMAAGNRKELHTLLHEALIILFIVCFVNYSGTSRFLKYDRFFLPACTSFSVHNVAVFFCPVPSLLPLMKEYGNNLQIQTATYAFFCAAVLWFVET